MCCVCPGGRENVHFYGGIGAVGDEGVEFFCGGGIEVGVGLCGVVGIGLAVGDVQVGAVAGRHGQGGSELEEVGACKVSQERSAWHLLIRLSLGETGA